MSFIPASDTAPQRAAATNTMKIASWLLYLAGLAFALFTAVATAATPCRIAFDLGSSGIRVGADNSSVIVKADIDLLGPLWAGRGLRENLAPTLVALRDLPEQAGFPSECVRIGGGFSAWRLALQQAPEELISILRQLHAESGVAVLVIPPQREGAYGYFGAEKIMGKPLSTTHVLDIGGGSLQIAGEHSTFAAALGQKFWHRHLCQKIRHSTSTPCALQPMSAEELASARALLAEKLKNAKTALPETVTLTSISRPVSRGILPALQNVTGNSLVRNTLLRSSLIEAIRQIASLNLEQTTARTGNRSPYVAFLLSDMLLLDGLMQMTGNKELQVAEVDLTNLPGLLADDRAFSWGQHYACYLKRLSTLGLEAYSSDPASCP